MKLKTRMYLNIIILIICSGITFGLYRLAKVMMLPLPLLSGWLLLLTILGLTVFNFRKKIPILRFWGTSATWLQVHIYLGLFCIFTFSLHVNGLPDTFIEQILFLLFVIVAGSGVFGIYISRTLPRKLSTRGEEVIFERIPVLRLQLREKTEEIVLKSIEKTTFTTIADFYAQNLANFFTTKQHFFAHLVGSFHPLKKIEDKMKTLNLYLSAEEKEISQEVWLAVEKKYDLDYHYTNQMLLKFWLFVHIPCTYSLIIFSLVHGYFAHVYAG